MPRKKKPETLQERSDKFFAEQAGHVKLAKLQKECPDTTFQETNTFHGRIGLPDCSICNGSMWVGDALAVIAVDKVAHLDCFGEKG